MVNVFDVVKFILGQRHQTTAMKLQKLVYYCQAWSLVWDEQPLFRERIEAWVSGPVIPELYKWHKGRYEITDADINCRDTTKLSKDQIETISAVLDYYGGKSPQWLSDLTHMEDPWRKAREGLPNGQRGRREITLASMEEYYSSLMEDE